MRSTSVPTFCIALMLTVAGISYTPARAQQADKAPPGPVEVSAKIDTHGQAGDELDRWTVVLTIDANGAKSQVRRAGGMFSGAARIDLPDCAEAAAALDKAAAAVGSGTADFKSRAFGAEGSTVTIATAKVKEGDREIIAVQLQFPGLMGAVDSISITPDQAKQLAEAFRSAPQIDARLRKCVDAAGMFK